MWREPRDNRKDVAVTTANGGRGLLWVDRVGGYLLLLADRVTVGQATPDSNVDIPILGDLSRRHAIVRRCNETYILEPLAAATLNGFHLTSPTPLSDGDEIGLGLRVRLRFRQPTPLSNTARLELISQHHLQPSVDGVLLFGETCLLGPLAQHHVVCPGWEQPIVLSRDERLGFRFRARERVEIDGVLAADSGIISWNTNLAGRSFALRLERL
jgi:hypothetical protein